MVYCNTKSEIEKIKQYKIAYILMRAKVIKKQEGNKMLPLPSCKKESQCSRTAF